VQAKIYDADQADITPYFVASHPTGSGVDGAATKKTARRRLFL
jgi:hypothetical protein